MNRRKYLYAGIALLLVWAVGMIGLSAMIIK